MIVKELIKALRKMPPDSKIVWVDHDQDSEGGEFNNFVRTCFEASDELVQASKAEVVLAP